ncbi:MAG: hypothetical protein JWM19_5329 [Actinomycetia bacterium]|nr:hypothetical protein [Actinomycetes bacterium]
MKVGVASLRSAIFSAGRRMARGRWLGRPGPEVFAGRPGLAGVRAGNLMTLLAWEGRVAAGEHFGVPGGRERR